MCCPPVSSLSFCKSEGRIQDNPGGEEFTLTEGESQQNSTFDGSTQQTSVTTTTAGGTDTGLDTTDPGTYNSDDARCDHQEFNSQGDGTKVGPPSEKGADPAEGGNLKSESGAGVDDVEICGAANWDKKLPENGEIGETPELPPENAGNEAEHEHADGDKNIPEISASQIEVTQNPAPEKTGDESQDPEIAESFEPPPCPKKKARTRKRNPDDAMFRHIQAAWDRGVAKTFWVRPKHPTEMPLDQMLVKENWWLKVGFLWAPSIQYPEFLRDGLPCGDKNCKGHCGKGSKTQHSPRTAISLSDKIFVLTERAVCRTCHASTTALNVNVLQKLPLAVQGLLPFTVLTSGLLIDNNLMSDIRSSVANTEILDCLSQRHLEKFYSEQLRYCELRRKYGKCEEAELPWRFTEDWNGWVPLLPFFHNVYLLDFISRAHYLKREVQGVGGEILKVDGTYKIAKKIRTDKKKFQGDPCMVNVLNEIGQCVAFVVAPDDSAAPLQCMWRGLRGRYTENKFPDPRVVYVDKNCCSGNSDITECFPNAKICLDPWHLLARFSKDIGPRSDGYTLFCRRLSQCFFTFNESDMKLLKKAYNLEGIDWDESEWDDQDLQFLRRYLKDASEIRKRLDDLLADFATFEVEETKGKKRPFLSEKTFSNFHKGMCHIHCCTDPVGIELYRIIGYKTFSNAKRGSLQVPIYYCARGTGQVENFHSNQSSWLGPPRSWMGSDLAHAILLDRTAKYNRARANEIAAIQGKVKGKVQETFPVVTDSRFVVRLAEQFPCHYKSPILSENLDPLLEEFGLRYGEFSRMRKSAEEEAVQIYDTIYSSPNITPHSKSRSAMKKAILQSPTEDLCKGPLHRGPGYAPNYNEKMKTKIDGLFARHGLANPGKVFEEYERWVVGIIRESPDTEYCHVSKPLLTGYAKKTLKAQESESRVKGAGIGKGVVIQSKKRKAESPLTTDPSTSKSSDGDDPALGSQIYSSSPAKKAKAKTAQKPVPSGPASSRAKVTNLPDSEPKLDFAKRSNSNRACRYIYLRDTAKTTKGSICNKAMTGHPRKYFGSKQWKIYHSDEEEDEKNKPAAEPILLGKGKRGVKYLTGMRWLTGSSSKLLSRK